MGAATSTGPPRYCASWASAPKSMHSLAEANGAVHAIDVAARRTVAGVDLLWIVECKYWNKPVDMGAVRDLRSLVLDLGADRGLLMSESGFQSGAIRTARTEEHHPDEPR